MTPYSSDREQYNAGYLKWLISYSKYWLRVPASEADELLEWVQISIRLTIYLLFMLLAPISFPAMTLFIMLSSKRSMLKQHGKDNLRAKEN